MEHASRALRPRYLRPSMAPGADRPALYDDARGWIGHGELAARVDALARRLAGFPRSLAVLFMRQDVASVVAYLAAVEAGHPLLLLDGEGRPEVRARLLAAYRPELLLDPTDASHDAEAHLAFTQEVSVWSARWTAGGALHPDLALLLPTSGSTGGPKLVRLARAGLEANAAAIAAYLGLGPAERALASLPFGYAYGLSVLNSHLLAGGAVVLAKGGVLAPGFWATAERAGATSLAGVPYTYQLLDRTGFARTCPPTLGTLTQAGGRLDPAIAARFQALMHARGGRYFTMYGQTEATARMAYVPADRAARKLGSAGRAIPGGRLVVERDGVPVDAPGVAGEVVYHGPNVMLGYAGCRADLARGDELGGRLATGDLGHLDADGYLWLHGRTSRFAKLFGLRIGLDEVEGLMRGHGPVAAVDEGDRLGIFGEWPDDLDLAALTRELAGRLGLPAAALRLQRVAGLPLLPAGKVDYQALKELRP
jgi:acyl-CoA synthetase (AMP-forming)/AMP-acid ligase II